MKIGITPLIAENIAPTNAKTLSIYKGNTKVCDVDISKMKVGNLGTKLYSFGLLSDLHMMATNNTTFSTNGTRLNNALTFFENQGCSFACHSGDTTNVGFYAEGDTTNLYPYQFNEYKRIRDLHTNLPIYGVCGNHDSYVKAITNNLTDLETYTGYGLNFTIAQGNDLFIFIGQPNGSTPMTDEALTWLETTLEANKKKRCFLFVHSFVDDMDSGNPLGLYSNKIFDWWGNKKTTFINLMKKYKKVLLIHGHSHFHFDAQKEVKNAIYSTTLGFHSLHCPSIYNYRNIVNGQLTSGDGCLGYVVDVYENHIVLKGYDFLNNDFVPIAQYCIQF